MHNRIVMTVAVALAALANTLPAPAGAQLTYQERLRAEETAKIQARAQATERAKADEAERKRARDRLQIRRDTCVVVTGRRWDSANESCK